MIGTKIALYIRMLTSCGSAKTPKSVNASNHHKDERKGGQRSSNCGLNQGLAFQSNPQMKEQSLFDCIFLVSQIYFTNPLWKICDLFKWTRYFVSALQYYYNVRIILQKNSTLIFLLRLSICSLSKRSSKTRKRNKFS